MDATITWVLIFVGVMERLLRLWIVVDDPECITDTSGKNIYLWGSILLVTSVISAILFWEQASLNYILITFATVFLVFRASMEWKYIREEREHVVTLTIIVIQSVCFLVFVG